jgi:hypothetical protein
MAITGFVHDAAKKHMVDGAFPWTSTMSPRAMLVLKNTWTPQASDNFVQTAITAGATELSASGYARLALVGLTTSQDDGNTRALISAGTIHFANIAAAQNFNALMIFNFVTNDTDSWLIATYDLGGTQTTNGLGWYFALNAAGLIALT